MYKSYKTYTKQKVSQGQILSQENNGGKLTEAEITGNKMETSKS